MGGGFGCGFGWGRSLLESLFEPLGNSEQAICFCSKAVDLSCFLFELFGHEEALFLGLRSCESSLWQDRFVFTSLVVSIEQCICYVRSSKLWRLLRKYALWIWLWFLRHLCFWSSGPSTYFRQGRAHLCLLARRWRHCSRLVALQASKFPVRNLWEIQSINMRVEQNGLGTIQRYLCCRSTPWAGKVIEFSGE